MLANHARKLHRSSPRIGLLALNRRAKKGKSQSCLVRKLVRPRSGLWEPDTKRKMQSIAFSREFCLFLRRFLAQMQQK